MKIHYYKRNAIMEKYKMIADDLASKISNGDLPAGTKLPSENDLCDTYQVSRITIKKATDQLLQLGLINKRRGAGTFVKDISATKPTEQALSDVTFTGFSKQFAGHNVSTIVNLFEIIPAEGDVAEALCLTDDDFVYHIVRTRYVDGVAYVIEYTYMPIAVIPGINKHILQESIYSYITETLGLKPQSAHRTVRSLLPSKEELEMFATNEKFAILEVSQIAYLGDGRIFEYSRSHFHGGKYSFQSVSVW